MVLKISNILGYIILVTTCYQVVVMKKFIWHLRSYWPAKCQVTHQTIS